MKSIGEAGKKLALGFTAAFAAIGGTLAYVVSKTLESTDGLAKTADKLGVTTKALSAMRHAAELADMSTKELDTALQYLERNIGDAAQGTGQGKKAFEALELSIEDLQSAGPEQAFSMVIDRLNQVKSATDRTNYAMDIFGRTGSGVLNLTAAGLAEAKKEAEDLGIAMTRADARKIEEANDAITRLKAGFKGAAQTLTVALAPTITGTFRTISEKIKQLMSNGGLKIWALKTAMAVIEAFRHVVTAIGGAGEALVAFGRAFNAVYGNVVKIAGGLAALQLNESQDFLAVAQQHQAEGKDFDGRQAGPELDAYVAELEARVQNLRITADAAVAIVRDSESVAENLRNVQGQILTAANQATSSLQRQVSLIEKQAQAAEKTKASMADYAKVQREDHVKASALAEEYQRKLNSSLAAGHSHAEAIRGAYQGLTADLAKLAKISEVAADKLLKLAEARNQANAGPGGDILSTVEDALAAADRTE